jgi:hypothetical protein
LRKGLADGALTHVEEGGEFADAEFVVGSDQETGDGIPRVVAEGLEGLQIR